MNFKAFLAEEFSGEYVIKRTHEDRWEVTKFSGDKQPDRVYEVVKKGNKFTTDSPGFSKVGQNERNIRLVKKFIEDKEPIFMTYFVDNDGNITSKKFV